MVYSMVNWQLLYSMGRIITEQKGSQNISSYVYDALGRVTSKGAVNSTVAYTYDALGNIQTLTYPSGRVVNYSHDDASQLSSLSTNGISNISLSYNALGLAKSIGLPNGVTENKTYDALGRITKLDLTKDVTSLYSKANEYSPVGDVSKQSTTEGISSRIEDYAYDPLSRLTEQKNSDDDTVTNGYGYNLAGNLVKVNGSVQTFDDTGKILTSGDTSYSYDGLNNRIGETNSLDADKNKEYTWNPDGSMKTVKVFKNGVLSETVSYTYDAKGLMLNRAVNGNIVNTFTWNTNTIIPLMVSDGVYEYIYQNDRVPLAQVRLSDGVVTYLHKDINGSVTTSTDASGGLLGTTVYSPYGLPENPLQSSFGYAGEWTDNVTGHIYLRARWLDVITASFLSQDPLVQITGNSYGYTNGNPITQVDPLGLFSLNPLALIQGQALIPIAQKINQGWDGFASGVSQVNNSIGDGLKIAGQKAEEGAYISGQGIRTTVDWLNSNSGDISAVLGVVSIVTTPIPVISAPAAIGSVAFGAISVRGMFQECSQNNYECNWGEILIGSVSALAGAAGLSFKFASRLIGGTQKGYDLLGLTATQAGYAVTGINHKIKQWSNKEKC